MKAAAGLKIGLQIQIQTHSLLPTPPPATSPKLNVKATMGQVCFTAITSNRACPTVFIALSSVVQIIVLCACCPCQREGGGGVPPCDMSRPETDTHLL